MITSFQQSLSSVKDIMLDQQQTSSSSQPYPPVNPSGSSVVVHLHLRCSIHHLPTTTEVSCDVQPIPLIRVKQAVQMKKTVEETETIKGVGFPVKVRHYYTEILFFFIDFS